GRFFNFAVRVPMILDNLLAEGAIQPLTAVMVDNPSRTWQEAMTIREQELSCHAPFADFLAQELLTWLRQTRGFTASPAQTLVAGGSIGGLAAAFVAMQYPDIFGSVLAMSGSFWWRPDGDEEWEWLTRQFARRPFAPLRFYLEVGLLESSPSPTGFPGQLLASRHLRDVLQARGHDVIYEENMHGHDASTWPEVFGTGLRALSRISYASR
ncbi:MAG: prolyl oligopeptidase family serine peptidase, partial [Anaerolineales bacterium]|nr:prolyl oligopeptidase family serine peptidase [Anaerolineales bacterium]